MFGGTILANGFTHNNTKKCIYSKFTEGYGVIICLYIDDLLMFCTNIGGIQETKKYIS